MLSSLTVDVEEYYHATNLLPVAPPSQWYRLESRVEKSTDETLSLFDECGVKGTFFVLGSVARRHPGIVRKIVDQGHELASHGYNHQIAYNQTPAQFRRDVVRSRLLLQDISGARVRGYRAPNFSILPKNDWAYRVLLEAGYGYDSSCYPTYHPRYGNPNAPRNPWKVGVDGRFLTVFPLAVARPMFANRTISLPVAGGAYWRIFPYFLTAFGLKHLTRNDHILAVCYLHPWELDVGQPVFKELGLLTRFRHYFGSAKLAKRIKGFNQILDFHPLCEIEQALEKSLND